jgi:AcrR family transcriptional regulator
MQPFEPSRRERKKDETRERITQAAIDLIAERGFEATTVDDIAARADVAKGTFFNYFPRKEAVLDALPERIGNEMEQVTSEILADEGTALEKLTRFCMEITARHVENRELSRLFMGRLMASPHDAMENVPARMRALLRAIIEQGQERGDLRGDIDAGRASSMVQGIALGTVMGWLCSGPDAFDLQAEMKKRLQLFHNGLAARGGGSR